MIFQSWQLNLSKLTPLAIVFAFACVFFSVQSSLMGWVLVLCACCFCIALYKALVGTQRRIENRTLNLLSIFCIAILLWYAGDFGLLRTMINLMMVACCLKLINLHRKADYQIVSMTLLFLIACGMIFHQDLTATLFFSIIILLIFAALNALEQPKSSINKNIKDATVLVLQALPVTLLLFIVTPKLSPLWQMPAAKSTQTGLSETVTPGDIAELAKSTDLVFRAEFSGPLPSPDERYWRSIVLDYFDGKSWSIAKQNYDSYNWQAPSDNSNKKYEYVVIAEPTSTRWLYSLDIPEVRQDIGIQNIRFNQRYQLSLDNPLYKQGLYVLNSYPALALTLFSQIQDIERYLQVPENTNPRTQDYIKTITNDNMSVDSKIQAIAAHFANHPFKYTLAPPLMPTDPVDTFLFDQQLGFCSHYASAFTYMLRLAGIPARIVTGYQGGEQQSQSLISIYQYDAHAWVEAWQPDKGWVRYDPTAIVAPNRVISGLIDSLTNGQEFRQEASFAFLLFKDFPLLNEIRLILAEIDHSWSESILGFNQDTQKSLLKDMFGNLDATNMSYVLLGSFILIAIFIGTILLIKSHQPRSEWQKLNQHFNQKLSKRGFVKNTGETLADFISRVKPNLDEHSADTLDQYQRAYYVYQYQSHQNPEALQQIKRVLNRL